VSIARLYVLCAAGNVLLYWGSLPGGVSVISDVSGTLWKVRNILNASALTSVFTTGAFAVLAWIRVATEALSAESR
jgi:hypothetical protein